MYRKVITHPIPGPQEDGGPTPHTKSKTNKQVIVCPSFKMETLNSVVQGLRVGDCPTKGYTVVTKKVDMKATPTGRAVAGGWYGHTQGVWSNL